jgi:hypothetical protein
MIDSATKQSRRVGKAKRSRERAADGVPTMVGTAQARLCPPYGIFTIVNSPIHLLPRRKPLLRKSCKLQTICLCACVWIYRLGSCASIHGATRSVVDEIPKERSPRNLMLDSVTLAG